MARGEPQVNLRMPSELKSRLERAAALNRRTLTAEINARLARSLDAEEQSAGVREPAADYAAVDNDFRRLPDDVRKVLTRVIRAAADGIAGPAATALILQRKTAARKKVKPRKAADES